VKVKGEEDRKSEKSERRQRLELESKFVNARYFFLVSNSFNHTASD
jgi:hypothetical protein